MTEFWQRGVWREGEQVSLAKLNTWQQIELKSELKNLMTEGPWALTQRLVQLCCTLVPLKIWTLREMKVMSDLWWSVWLWVKQAGWHQAYAWMTLTLFCYTPISLISWNFGTALIWFMVWRNPTFGCMNREVSCITLQAMMQGRSMQRDISLLSTFGRIMLELIGFHRFMCISHTHKVCHSGANQLWSNQKDFVFKFAENDFDMWLHRPTSLFT